MNTFPVMLGALCVYALAYRYYSAFIAAKALALDDLELLFRQGGLTQDLAQEFEHLGQRVAFGLD